MTFIEMMREILKSDKWASGLHGAPENTMLSPDASPAVEDVPPLKLLPGMRVEWKSPLFGTLTGEVLDADEAHILVWHPKAEALRNIPVKWVTRIQPEAF
jgi:hypothetical protein